MFMSYYIVDPDTDYHQKVGRRIAIKYMWGRERTFCETYFRHGTWRKVMNGNKPMVAMCPSTPEWQEKMIESADRILSYGADGVLYDIGGMGPVFCHDSRHPHANPSLAFATKRQNYRALRENIKRQNPEAIIAMEHNVDIYGESMDLAQSGGSARPEACLSGTVPLYVPGADGHKPRSCRDERNYRDNIHFSLLYGLRFDMTIFRCQGELDDIPNYRDYLTKVTRCSLTTRICCQRTPTTRASRWTTRCCAPRPTRAEAGWES